MGADRGLLTDRRGRGHPLRPILPDAIDETPLLVGRTRLSRAAVTVRATGVVA